jgi:diaphanous 1
LGGVLDRVLIRRREARSGNTNHNALSDVDEDIRSECMKCLRVLLNTESGFLTVLNSPMVISKIAFCLHTSNDKLRTAVAEILAAIIVLSGEHGHRCVLTAMQDFKGFYNERARFEYLVSSIIGRDAYGKKMLSTIYLISSAGVADGFSDARNPMAAFEYRTTAMSLVNAIVAAPDSLEARIQLRDEFFRRGLTSKVLAEMKANAPANLLTQIDLYEEDMREDMKEADVLVQQTGINLR